MNKSHVYKKLQVAHDKTAGMRTDTPFMGVAFRRGCLKSVGDDVVMQGTWGPYVHSEFVLGKNSSDIRCYTACSSPDSSKYREGFLSTQRWTSLTPPEGWEVIIFPINEGMTGYRKAYALILQLLSLHIPYNYKDLWQCCVKAVLSHEKDVVCTDAKDWQRHGVFCSQACLLLLRQFANQNLITLSVHAQTLVSTINSRGCSPNCLYRIISYAKKN